MKMNNRINGHARGQILILYAFGIVILIALAALVLDGGMLFLNRRAGQAAADAGALAGAKIKCNGDTVANVIATAEHYAEVENSANDATATWDGTWEGDVVVNVTIDQDSFFAQIFGMTTWDVPATASANCFPPGAAKNVLPVAWACRPPVGASTSEDCQIQALEWETEMKPLIRSNFFNETGDVIIQGEIVPRPPFRFTGRTGNITDQVYIVMDSEQLSEDMAFNCFDPDTNPTGDIYCDIDGDGVPNISAPGDRSWLFLEEGKGAADLRDWIENGLANPLSIHTWLAGGPGTETSVFQAVRDYATATASDPYKFVTIPVFDDYCERNPYTQPLCSGKIHAEDQLVRNDPNNYFHVIAFAAFYVTCVDTTGSVSCPAAYAANLPGRVKSVEGYFVRGAPITVGPGGTGELETGVYLVSLTQ